MAERIYEALAVILSEKYGIRIKWEGRNEV